MEAKTFKPLDDLLDKTGYKLTYIAEQLGIKPSTLYKWRVSPNMIGVDGMEGIAKLTGVDFIDVYNIVKKFKEKVD
ncbi:hypothetical protein D3H64_06185 [Atopobacter sp. AH10]|uniref:hypothetical protein n=1 Tax=Atopobacter sp. AH10 TaxID=2315861 RepID=UPI000EF186CB|nr:hypothetical protein [Atopobacter sp. AH10]RLK63177.1 hypothetical protein D3H64_06185 [Atopobacter sp. AH10]